MLEIKNVSKSFGEKRVLKDVSLTLGDGEIISILGVSGSGKTTLFNVVSGLMPCDEGEIILDGETINGKTGKLSYMLQKDLLLPYYTVIDNVSLPLVVKKKMKKKDARRYAAKFFKRFGLEGTEKFYPSRLSGGMKQRAAFLRTYLSSDGVALLDEPFSALDTITKSAIHEWYLNIMNEINLSTIFVTHDIDEAILLSDRVLVLSKKPGTISACIDINEPKPRHNDFTLSDDFIAYKKAIIEKLGQI